MASYLKIASVAAAGFFRLGRRWPQAGELVPAASLTEDEIARLKGEPQLRVTEADGPAPALPDAELKTLLKGAIAALAKDEFQKDGKPRLEALKAALPEHKDRITAAFRDEVWGEIAPAG